jgi:hypothetical protein
MHNSPDISFFQKVTDTTPSTNMSALDVLFSIRDGQYNTVKFTQELLRAETDKKKQTAIKKKLPAVTWSGSFNQRNKEDLKYYSQLICMDIDKIDDPAALKLEFAQDEYVLAAFISPSGNGLKVIYNTFSNYEEHEAYFESLASYIVNTYGVVIDPKCKDVCRLCFISYDPAIYINEDCKLYHVDLIDDGINPQPEPTPEQIKPIPTQKVGISYLEKCDEIARKKHQPQAGSYNHYITTFAIYARRYDIAESECISHLQSTCAAHDQKETAATVKSTYAKFANEAGTWIKTKHASTPKPKAPAPNNEPKKLIIHGVEVDDSCPFWYEVQNEKTGKIEYKFGYDDAINFLHNNGFYRFPIDNDYYQFIHVKEAIKQVEVIQPIKIKDFFLQYLTSNTSGEFKAVREMFRRGAKNYCSINLLEGLNYFVPTFKKDTKDTAFIYFKNSILEITATGILEQKYTTLDKYIWSKQVIDFNYKATDYASSDFARFVTLAIIGAKKPIEDFTPIEIQKLESFSTTIGYLLHRFKNPALTKAVVAVDKSLRSTGENNGRTGKSLLSKAIGKMLNVCTIDGKNFKFDSPFPFQKANIDTALINFNDVLKNFDFERLFGMITEEFTFEKKGKDSITLPFEAAPKFYISTNTTLKGSGESNKGRQQIIEFDNYFNAKHAPIHEFGRMFFTDEWDEHEYAMFYTYMVECIKYYLENGLIEFPLENYEINKLIDTAGEEFIDYMNETVLEQLRFTKEFEEKKLFDTFIEKNKSRDKTNIKTFNKNVKAWATIKALEINLHKGGQRDRRNGISYVTFTPKINEHEETEF